MRITATIALCLLAFSALGQSSTPVRILDTMADLVARKAIKDETVQVKNRSASILWSAPRTFTAYSTSAVTNAHDGTHYVTNGAAGSIYVSADRNDNRQDPRWFGAKPDDEADDITAIDAAIEYGYQNSGRTIDFSSGVWDVSRSVKLKPRVNLLGPGVNFASVRTDTNYTALGNAVIRLMADSNVPLLVNDHEVGQLYQPDEITFDGSTNQSRLYQLSVKGLVFHANGDNQTAGPADAIHLDSVWGIDIEGCAFMRPRGYVGRFRNANAVNVRNCTFGGSTTRSKGLLMEAVADVRWSDITVFQTAGPGYHWISSAYGHYVNLYQFGSVFPRVDGTDYWWTNFPSGDVTNNIITVDGDVPFERGDAIQFYNTTGNLFGVSDFTTYYVYPLTANTFTLNRNYRLATNGVATTLTPLYSSSGTVEVGIGPNVGAFLTESLILGIHSLHVDENLEGGVAIWNASDNQIVGLTSHRNAGTPGSSFATNVTSAVTLRGASRRNIISAPTVRDATNAVTLEYNAGDNRILGLSPNLVLTNFVTVAGGEQSWFDAVRDVRTRTLWLDTTDASPSWKAARSGGAAIDFAVSGTDTSPQFIFRESTNAMDLLWFNQSSGVNRLAIGGNTYDSTNNNQQTFAAAITGSIPSGGHLTNQAAKRFEFYPSFGTGTGDTNGGYFRWLLPQVNTNSAGETSIHEGTERLLLSHTNLVSTVPIAQFGPLLQLGNPGDRGSIQYVTSTDTLRMIGGSTVEVWAGSADREFAVTSAGIIVDLGKGISLNGVLQTNWPSGGTVAWGDITGKPAFGDLSLEDWPPSDGQEYVLKNGALAVATGGGGGSGTVTSVALTVPNGFSVSGSPVTTNGTMAISGVLGAIAGGTGITNTTAAGQALLSAADAAAQRALLTVTNYYPGTGLQMSGSTFSHNIEAGTNVTLTTNGTAIVVNASGGGGGTTNLVSSSASGLAPQATIPLAVLGTDDSTNVAWAPRFAPVITESGTTLTLALTNAGQYIRLTSASSCAITVPNQTNVNLLVGTEIYFRVAAAGIPTLTGQGGVTLNGTNFISSLSQHSTFGIKCVDTNIWDAL